SPFRRLWRSAMWCVRGRAYAPFNRAAVVGSLLLMTGCTSHAPSAPDPFPAKTDHSSQPGTPAALATSSVKLAASFGLLDGSFVLTTGAGSTLTGTYTGTANVAADTQSSALTLWVTGGTGVFQGAGGSLNGDG